jgi:hypothetical protein
MKKIMMGILLIIPTIAHTLKTPSKTIIEKDSNVPIFKKFILQVSGNATYTESEICNARILSTLIGTALTLCTLVSTIKYKRWLTQKNQPEEFLRSLFQSGHNYLHRKGLCSCYHQQPTNPTSINHPTEQKEKPKEESARKKREKKLKNSQERLNKILSLR